MKKFEEELKKLNYDLCVDTYDNKRLLGYEEKNLVIIFKDWVSPEDYQKTEESNKAYETSNLRMSEENAKFVVENIELTKEIAELKSQLEKQQPEIPEFVAKYIKETADPIHEMCAWAEHYGDNGTKCDDPELSKMLDWFGMSRILFYKSAVNGYTVAKEKRFYLKNKLTGLYLTLNTGENKYYEHHHDCALKNHEGWKYKFTPQEIDSMETGSYEQIEVEE